MRLQIRDALQCVSTNPEGMPLYISVPTMLYILRGCPAVRPSTCSMPFCAYACKDALQCVSTLSERCRDGDVSGGHGKGASRNRTPLYSHLSILNSFRIRSQFLCCEKYFPCAAVGNSLRRILRQAQQPKELNCAEKEKQRTIIQKRNNLRTGLRRAAAMAK